MKLQDIIKQGVKNLLRHRGRTMLTVLGVIVGCCSVVIMISIGIGMRISSEATLAQMGDLNKIEVYVKDKEIAKLDDQAVARIKAIEHANVVIPKIRAEVPARLLAGAGNRYAAEYITLIGEDLDLARQEGYELAEGDWENLKKGEVLAGQYLAYAYSDTKRPEGHNRVDRYEYYDWQTDSYMDLPDSYVNLLTEPMTLVIGDEPGTQDARYVTKSLKVGAVMKEDYNRGYETSEGLLVDADVLKGLLADYAKQSGSKKAAEVEYSEIIVKVDHISDVESVEKEIRKLGFTTFSMDSIRKPMEQDMQQKQMLLGCVGAVSLFVAALGIANTMIMAISERVREIGVMKSLGCFLRDIRKLFLLEAGCIGLLGGVIGIGLSYGISTIMNAAGTGTMFGNEYDYLIDSTTMNISVIPWWLAVFAVLFSILVGVVAGLYPAEKAVRIPALDAIRHE